MLRVTVEDNGPGIVEEQLGRIFGKLLYGSKFHKLSQSRGPTGNGDRRGRDVCPAHNRESPCMFSAACRAKPRQRNYSCQSIRRRIGPRFTGRRESPGIARTARASWRQIEGHYHRAGHSIGMYLRQTAIANAHVTIHFRGPHGEQWDHERSSTELPARPVNIKPHPRGVELGQLIQMLSNTESRTLLQFLENDLSRVGRKTARRIIELADQALTERSYPRRIAHLAVAGALPGDPAVPVMPAPCTDCISPIGEQRSREGCTGSSMRAFTP